ncbi:MAG: 4Fe-4S binding protein [Clostridiaceae bacterium]|nr:4Fe-4S binding protein [Clostridiaceae bacterium]
MAKITFETDLCKGCGLCVDACPKKILRINREQINQKGHSPATVTNMAVCIGCGSCAMMCPDCVITVER